MNNEQLKRNVMRVERSSDQSVTVAFTSCRMASLFEKWLSEREPQPALADQPRLKVQVRSFPESNGKRNWTALITRVDNWGGLIGNCHGITVDHGEFWNRVAYHAEEVKLLLGQRDTEPHILDYGDDIETPDRWLGEVRGGIPLRKTGKPEITNSGRQLPDVSTPTPMPPVKQPKSAQVPEVE